MRSRTSLITAAAVVGALLAGTGAIAANIGVLTSAGDDSIGNLSAGAAVETPSTTVEAQVIDIYVEDPPSASPTGLSATGADDPAVVQQFAVGDAGTVTVERTPTGLFLGDVRANGGWEWSNEQSGADELTVTFTSGATTYEFHATVGTDGLIAARVDQPIVNVVRSPAPATASSRSGGDEDDDHDDHDEYEDDDHEGGDDDD